MSDFNDPFDAYNVDLFCKTHNISKVTFYRLKKEGSAPKMYYIGRRPYISREAATNWRREMEATAA